jgi:hypothetical protein
LLIALFFGYAQIHGNAMKKAKTDAEEQTRRDERTRESVRMAIFEFATLSRETPIRPGRGLGYEVRNENRDRFEELN